MVVKFISLVLCSVVVLGTPALAQSYLGVQLAYGSGGKTDNQWTAASPRYRLPYGDAKSASAIFGRDFGNWRGELELSGSKAGPTDSQPAAGVNFEAKDTYLSALASAHYDLPLTPGISASVGVGAGPVRRKADLVQTTPLPVQSGAIRSTNLAFFGQLGLNLEISSTVDVYSAFRAQRNGDSLNTWANNVWIGLRFKL